MSDRCIQKERILCIDDNQEALIWRLRVIEAARQEIILTTFDIEEDHSGRDIMAALLNAAKRGVKVEILIDGINGKMHLQDSDCFRLLVNMENVKVKFYNPVKLGQVLKISYRMHDKYLVADNFVYILGGRNTNDLFLGEYRDRYNIDRDILVYESKYNQGNSLYQLRRYFESIWSSSESIDFFNVVKKAKISNAADTLKKHYEALQKKYPQAFKNVNWETETMEVESVKLLTNPIMARHKQPELWDAICDFMETGNEIWICTPYIICDRKMYQDLASLCNGERQIKIMINAVENGANPWGCVDYLNQKKKILKKGIEIFEFLGGQSLHTKAILVDKDISIVGSFNLDIRSAYLDTEMMLLIKSNEFNAKLRDKMMQDAELSKHVLPDGSEKLGRNYGRAEMTIKKRIVYSLLRTIIVPFRHLL